MCVFTHKVLRKAECCGFIVSNDVYLSIYYKCPYFIHISPIYFFTFCIESFPFGYNPSVLGAPGSTIPGRDLLLLYNMCICKSRESAVLMITVKTYFGELSKTMVNISLLVFI